VKDERLADPGSGSGVWEDEKGTLGGGVVCCVECICLSKHFSMWTRYDMHHEMLAQHYPFAITLKKQAKSEFRDAPSGAHLWDPAFRCAAMAACCTRTAYTTNTLERECFGNIHDLMGVA
jgi:hypothetical protein